MMNTLKQLREAAEAARGADPGDWLTGRKIKSIFDAEDADHIAAADPDTIIALLDALEAAEGSMSRLRRCFPDDDNDPRWLKIESATSWALDDIDAALAKIAALKGES